MRLLQTPPTLLSLLLVVLSRNHPVEATPFPRDDFYDIGFGYLEERGCYAYCGVNKFCCNNPGQTACSTDSNNVASCVAPTAVADSNSYQVYTTVYTETDLIVRTSIYTSWPANSYVATTTVTGYPPPSCSTGLPVCGSICCATYQTCAFANQCAAITSGASDGGAIPFSAPFLVVGGAVTTTTGTVTNPTAASATRTGTNTATPVASTSSGGLSGGAIAGIVIGVIAGIILFLLICFCCCLRAGFHTISEILGLRKKDRRRTRTKTTERVEHYSSRHSGTASRKTHRNWFGQPTRPGEKKKGSGLGGFGAVGAGLLGLAAMLGLKRRGDAKKKQQRPARPPPSDYSDTYYSTTYTGTSASSESSEDRRTRGTRTSKRG